MSEVDILVKFLAAVVPLSFEDRVRQSGEEGGRQSATGTTRSSAWTPREVSKDCSD